MVYLDWEEFRHRVIIMHGSITMFFVENDGMEDSEGCLNLNKDIYRIRITRFEIYAL